MYDVFIKLPRCLHPERADPQGSLYRFDAGEWARNQQQAAIRSYGCFYSQEMATTEHPD